MPRSCQAAAPNDLDDFDILEIPTEWADASKLIDHNGVELVCRVVGSDGRGMFTDLEGFMLYVGEPEGIPWLGDETPIDRVSVIFAR